MEISINRGRDDVDNVPNERDVKGKAIQENEITGSSQDVVSSSHGFPTPIMVTKEDFLRTVRDTSCYWVYARFSDENNSVAQSLYALDINGNGYVRLPSPPMNFFLESMSSVLDYNLYVIGGRGGEFISCLVHMFDPVLHNWSDVAFSRVQRSAGQTVSVAGRIYVFGGCEIENARWAEFYDPSIQRWTGIPGSKNLTDAHNRGLSPLQASAVLGDIIFLLGRRIGITLDVVLGSWNPVSDNLMRGWCNCIRAAVVKNMLITCYGDINRHETFQPSIRAYDPYQDIWFMLEGIDNSFHENAHRSEFMSVNGKLVIYHMWEKDDLRYSVFEINERLRTTVRASLLWQSRFDITTIINQGLDIHPDRLSECVYKHSLMEAFRADRWVYQKGLLETIPEED